MLLDDPSSSQNRWTPKLDRAVSFEHRECIKLAYRICAATEKNFPEYFEALKNLPSVESLQNEKHDKPFAALIGFNRESEEHPIGSVDGFEYVLKLSRRERVISFRVQQEESGLEKDVSEGTIEISIEPASLEELRVNPLSTVDILVSRRADKRTLEDPTIIVEVRSSRTKGRIIPDDPLSESFDDDPNAVPSHALELHQVAQSPDPELGDNALVGIKAVLEQANSFLASGALRK